LVELIIEPAQLGKDAASGVYDGVAGLRRPHTAGVAIKQTSVYDLLQLMQALG
jgi:hypothetical protein